MPLNEQELQQLGAQILNVDKDKFGLKTDGQGNVIVPEGSSFMAEVLKIDRKYLLFGDPDHDDTFEQLFTPKNVAALKAAGVQHVFSETNDLENKYLRKLATMPAYRISQRHPMSQLFVGELQNLSAAGIARVAVDPREKFGGYTAETKNDIALLQKAGEILEWGCTS